MPKKINVSFFDYYGIIGLSEGIIPLKTGRSVDLKIDEI